MKFIRLRKDSIEGIIYIGKIQLNIGKKDLQVIDDAIYINPKSIKTLETVSNSEKDFGILIDLRDGKSVEVKFEEQKKLNEWIKKFENIFLS